LDGIRKGLAVGLYLNSVFVWPSFHIKRGEGTMDVVNLKAGGKGRRLPVKGDEKNISELTAIARIKPGNYPNERLPNDYKQPLFEDMTEVIGTIVQPTQFENNLQKLCDLMVKGFIDEAQPPLITEKQIDMFLKKSHIPQTHAPTIKTIFKQSEDKLLQFPREMTWLRHLEQVGNRSHEKRQDAIRKMSTIHYARWFIVDENTLPGLDGAHLVFTSNYDGILDDYLEDFANVDEGPLNVIFGHCIGWPGARPVEGFIHYVKEHQHSALIFYANYPLATVGEIRRAFDWKNKTQCFIEEDVPKLLDNLPAGSSAVVREALKHYLNELAKPTPKNEVQKINPGLGLKMDVTTDNSRQRLQLTI
jgi:hypothetical protein